MRLTIVALVLFAFALAGPAVTTSGTHAQSTPAQSTLESRGAHGMGFDQEKTVHHFRVYEDGGAIDVAVKDPADATNLSAIRAHLPHIAHLFGQGDFNLPHFIHATNVPGTSDLTKLKDRVRYTYVETLRGGRVDIVTTDAAAIAAVHAFLRFQIADHKTGDDPAVVRRPPGGR
jgi:hypothetical protein